MAGPVFGESDKVVKLEPHKIYELVPIGPDAVAPPPFGRPERALNVYAAL